MPLCLMITNVPQSKIPSDFNTKVTKLMASSLNKQEAEVMVNVISGSQMTFGGTNEPCGLVDLKSIGKLGVEENKVLSKVFGEFLEQQLGIKQNRYFIIFDDLAASGIGYLGTTVEELWAKK